MTRQQEKDRIDIINELKEEIGQGPTPEGFRLMGRIRRISALYVKKMNKILQQKFDSDCGEYDVLGTINWRTKENECITPGQLAKTTVLSSSAPALTNRLNCLETKGLISRDRDTTDRRLVLIGLTPEGRKMAQEMDTAYDQFLTQYFNHFKSKEQDDLVDLLRKLILCFENE